MYQVARAILLNKSDNSKLALVFGNITEEDILLRDEWDQLVKEHADRLTVHYVLNTPPAGWTGGSGFITADVIKSVLPAPADDVMVLRCGPLPMNVAMKAHLDGLGYSESMQFEF
jgi:cytochrome-b5 reductase